MFIRCFLSDWESRKEEYAHIVENPKKWNQVPLINVVPNHELCDLQLVRFRGMVQHMHNPEYFMGQYEIENNVTKVKEMRSGRYRDVIQCSPDEKLVDGGCSSLQERQVFFCITTPALNDWVCQQEVKLAVQTPRSDEHDVSCARMKRQFEDELMETDSAEHGASSALSATSNRDSIVAKRSPVVKKDSNSKSLPSCSSTGSNFPIDGASGMACIVKVSGIDSSTNLKLNDVIDVVGFLSLHPSLAHSSSSSAVASDLENISENPPPSLVPRLHAIALQKVNHLNELPSDLDQVFHSATRVRKELHFLLTQILLGDTLAADYLICHLLSLVYMRKEGLALGHFSINLSNLPQRPDYTQLLYSVLERILPKSHYFPMTLENMNTLSLSPKMDYEANRLSSGLLQLSDNTHLIVDETRLETGKLDAAGVTNVQALRTLISQQVVYYDFQYYSKPYDADVPVLILSEGKSLLPCDVLVPLQADLSCLNTLPETFQAANHFLQEPLLSAIRSFLCVIRHASHEFPDELQKKAQDDFVAMRQAAGQSVSADDLHVLLVLSRLVSLSNGQRNVSLDAWEEAKRMEEERKKRINQSQFVRTSNEP